MTVAGVLRKIFGFLYLSLTLSLTLPRKGKMLWWSYFRPFIKSINLDRGRNLIKKFNFVSTPLKIIIPIAHHPPYHPLNTPSPMPPTILPPPPTTSLTSTPHTLPPTHPIPTPHTTTPLVDLGGHAWCMPPYGTQFFHFCIYFHQKVPTLEVHTPPNGCTPPPPYGKSWICHCTHPTPTPTPPPHPHLGNSPEQRLY